MNEFNIKLGYKIKLVQVFLGETFEHTSPVTDIAEEVKQWLKELEISVHREAEQWAEKVMKSFKDNGIIDFSTLAKIPQENFPSFGFNSFGTKHALKIKLMSYSSPPSQPSSSSDQTQHNRDLPNAAAMVETEEEHKYEQSHLPDLRPLFVNGQEKVREAFLYFTEKYNENLIDDKKAKKLENELINVIFTDIKNEQKKHNLRELYPAYNVLQNAANAIANTLPGVLEHHKVNVNDSLDQIKAQYVEKLIRKGNKGQIRGTLYERFNSKRPRSSRSTSSRRNTEDDHESTGSQPSSSNRRSRESPVEIPKNVTESKKI